jgi:hypothetical protein
VNRAAASIRTPLARLPSVLRRLRGARHALTRTDVTFDGQNNADNMRHCDTQPQAADIVRIFGAGTIRSPVEPSLRPTGQGSARFATVPYGELSCARYYLSYRVCADGNILLKMIATALASIRRRVCSH